MTANILSSDQDDNVLHAGACQCVREEDRPWTANNRHLWSGGALFREERTGGFKYKLLSGGENFKILNDIQYHHVFTIEFSPI